MSYSQAPPAYTPGAPKGYSALPQDDHQRHQPTSSSSSSQQPQASSYDPFAPRTEGDAEGDDSDFKYSVTVAQSDPEIRAQFIRKIYTILFMQILGTTAVGALMRGPAVTAWVQQNQWAFLIPVFGSLITMGLLFWKRHSHPLNLVLLSLFTVLEAGSLGAITSYVDQVVVLQALILTVFIFLGLTIISWQSKYDFSHMGSWLFGGLLLLIGVGFVQFFVPFSKTMDMVVAGAGVLIFSGYILYDTSMICRRLSPDEWVLGVISLYLDIVNLFINILRLLNDSRDN